MQAAQYIKYLKNSVFQMTLLVKFQADYVTACNSLCMLFACVAQKELDALTSNSLAT